MLFVKGQFPGTCKAKAPPRSQESLLMITSRILRAYHNNSLKPQAVVANFDLISFFVPFKSVFLIFIYTQGTKSPKHILFGILFFNTCYDNS